MNHLKLPRISFMYFIYNKFPRYIIDIFKVVIIVLFKSAIKVIYSGLNLLNVAHGPSFVNEPPLKVILSNNR